MPPGLRLSEAATGRVNIYAVGRGIVRFDREGLKQVNRIDEGVTLACVQHNQLVEDGDMIATLKIILCHSRWSLRWNSEPPAPRSLAFTG